MVLFDNVTLGNILKFVPAIKVSYKFSNLKKVILLSLFDFKYFKKFNIIYMTLDNVLRL